MCSEINHIINYKTKDYDYQLLVDTWNTTKNKKLLVFLSQCIQHDWYVYDFISYMNDDVISISAKNYKYARLKFYRKILNKPKIRYVSEVYDKHYIASFRITPTFKTIVPKFIQIMCEVDVHGRSINSK
jgi:hypothetical protein